MVDWVMLGTDVLHDARKRKGLSYEAMGRQLNVAAKTWERWEKRGEVPRHMLAPVAAVLELQIEELPPIRVAAGVQVLDELRAIRDRVEALLIALSAG